MDKNFKTPKYYINLPDYIVDKDDIGIILENLVRLNLIEIDFQKWLTDDEVYNNIKGQAEIKYKPTFKDLEYVSIAPNIYNAHSPDEKFSISSADKMWEYVVNLLKEI